MHLLALIALELGIRYIYKPYLLSTDMKRLLLVFPDEKPFKKLQNAKEAEKILGKINSWEEYFLMLAGVK